MEDNQDQTPAASSEAIQETVSSGLLDFAEPISAADNKQVTPETVAAAAAANVANKEVDMRSAKQRAEDEYKATLEKQKQDFVERVYAARESEQVIPKTQPVPERIASQTAAEMAAGAKMNAHHEGLKAVRAAQPTKAPDKNAGTMTPVFRPNDFVPDPKKGTGQVGARVLSA